MKRKAIAIYACLTFFALINAGCQSVHWSKGDWEKKDILNRPFKKKEEKTEFSTPNHIVIFWKESIYRGPSGEKTKGFGGRIYFYNIENEPVKVDGELTVYGFDDSIQGAERRQADRKFVFKQEDFQKHYSETDLGHSYSIWIPWNQGENPSEETKRISLLPVLKTADSKLVTGSQAIAVLSGTKPLTVVERNMPLREDGHFIRYASHNGVSGKDMVYQGEEPSPNANVESPAMKITTIPVPSTDRIPISYSTEPTAPPMIFNQMHEMAKRAAAEREAASAQAIPSDIASTDASTTPAVSTAASFEPAESANANTGRPATSTASAKQAERPVFGRPGSFR